MKDSFQSWRQLIVIQAGGALCLPLFIVGYHLGKENGFFSALLGIVIGNFLLYLLARVMFTRCLEKRQSTSELSIEVFGTTGKYFFSSVMVLSMIGWFVIQLIIMGEALSSLLMLSDEFTIPIRIGLGTLTVLTVLFGLKGLETVANFSLPLLCLTIAYAVLMSESSETISNSTLSLGFSGIALVIASCISAVIDLPTFFRQAKSKRDGFRAIALLFGIVIPLIQLTGVYLCLQNQAESLTEVLSLASSHPLWKIWIAFFVLFAGWTTNNTNIYSASVNMVRLTPLDSHYLRILIIGTLGIGLSTIPLIANFETILNLIGIFLASMGAAILLKRNEDSEFVSLVAWIIGAACGLISMMGLWRLSEMPLMDAFFVTSTLQIFWPQILERIKFQRN